MKIPKKALVYLTLYALNISCIAQLQPVYSFQKDDTVLRKNYYEQSLTKKKALVAALSNESKDRARDYKEIYENQFKEIGSLLQSSRAVTSSEAHQYLQSVVQKIISANPELKGTDARIVFSRDWWPNAYSMGDGTIAVNAGIMIFFDNEAELVFVLCHELAHYYLDHSNKAIKKYVELVNSESFQKELKRLSKEQYRVNTQLEELTKAYAFDSRKHSRANEAEADKQAFQFMKRTGYDLGAIKTCLQMLDNIDDTVIYKKPIVQQLLNTSDFPFRKKWIDKESSIFSQMSEDDSPLTKKEKDSLKTHPACAMRISLLADSIAKHPGGNKYQVNETLFNKLKKDFFIEITEECYKEKKLSRNLYYSLMLLQEKENEPMAIYSIARCLNALYDAQKAHKIGTMVDVEAKYYPEEYNLLLRMLNRLRLDELAALNYAFCRQYALQMKDYAGFEQEINKAMKNKN